MGAIFSLMKPTDATKSYLEAPDIERPLLDSKPQDASGCALHKLPDSYSASPEPAIPVSTATQNNAAQQMASRKSTPRDFSRVDERSFWMDPSTADVAD